jgi:hypothetical protein
MNSRLMNFVKPKPGEIWRDRLHGKLVEIVDVGMKYATVKTPGGDSRFKRMVPFQDLLSIAADEIPAPPTDPQTEAEMDEEFLEES